MGVQYLCPSIELNLIVIKRVRLNWRQLALEQTVVLIEQKNFESQSRDSFLYFVDRQLRLI